MHTVISFKNSFSIQTVRSQYDTPCLNTKRVEITYKIHRLNHLMQHALKLQLHDKNIVVKTILYINCAHNPLSS